ncbi:hypothetical protein [Streptomyces sp. JJ36]|uniref:hypothetical protein n=1 Tax=Streptomyces sp. JJ36 TaxID=2736645 RepID=UPI001F19AED9|nr:hypothetical protein [Streptomyces sp. JJ36]MCF6523115.1 hypothetical protein [Streptomyces sp. JJ36]
MKRAKGWAVASAAVLVVAGGTYVSANTNLLGSEELCHGLLTDSTVQEVIPGPGRLSSEDLGATSCRVTQSSLGIGAGDTEVELDVQSEDAGFPFERGLWQMTGRKAVFTEGATGVASARGGWVLLPEGCEVSGPLVGDDPEQIVLKAVFFEGEADPAGVARLLGEAAHGLAVRNDCDADAVRAPEQVAEPDPVRNTAPGKLCSLPGLEVSRLESDRGRPVEQTSGALERDWFCDLYFTDDTHGPYTQFAVVRDERLTAGARAADGPSWTAQALCDGTRTHFLMDSNDYPWNPEERSAAGLPDEQELFQRFVEAAAKAAGCPVPDAV